MRRTVIQVLVFGLFATPLVVMAQPANFEAIVAQATYVMSRAVAAVIGLGLVYLLWSGAVSVLQADNATQRAEGRTRVMWGIIGLFIAISMWALVTALCNTFKLCI